MKLRTTAAKLSKNKSVTRKNRSRPSGKAYLRPVLARVQSWLVGIIYTRHLKHPYLLDMGGGQLMGRLQPFCPQWSKELHQCFTQRSTLYFSYFQFVFGGNICSYLFLPSGVKMQDAELQHQVLCSFMETNKTPIFNVFLFTPCFLLTHPHCISLWHYLYSNRIN